MSTRFNNKTYFQMGIGFDDPFTRVPNIILDETNISAKALGIYVKIIRFQNSTEHKIYISSLANELKEGKDAIRSAIQELIELGYIEREILRNEKGHMNGYVYTVHAQPIENTKIKPSSEKPTSVNPVSDNTTLKKKIIKKENNKKENKVVVVENEKANNTKSKYENEENKLIDLYKSFKLEKRVMPHTLKLLKENIHIHLDVFNEIFISASDESVKKKYAYIKEIIDTLNKNNIKTLDEFNKFNNEYKESKNKYKYNKTKKDNNIYANNKNSFNNFESTFDKYTKEEFEQIVYKSQVAKYSSNKKLVQDDVKDLYDIFEK